MAGGETPPLQCLTYILIKLVMFAQTNSKVSSIKERDQSRFSCKGNWRRAMIKKHGENTRILSVIFASLRPLQTGVEISRSVPQHPMLRKLLRSFSRKATILLTNFFLRQTNFFLSKTAIFELLGGVEEKISIIFRWILDHLCEQAVKDLAHS